MEENNHLIIMLCLGDWYRHCGFCSRNYWGSLSRSLRVQISKTWNFTVFSRTKYGCFECEDQYIHWKKIMSLCCSKSCVAYIYLTSSSCERESQSILLYALNCLEKWWAFPSKRNRHEFLLQESNEFQVI